VDAVGLDGVADKFEVHFGGDHSGCLLNLW
jgi:hypothetical protein